MDNYKTDRVLAGRIRMNVMDWPSESSDPPVLFVHGITGSGVAGLRMARLVNGRRRFLSPDLRGRGKTDAPFGEYGVAVHARDLLACMDRLHIDRVVIAGHSLGGIVGLHLAATVPDRVAGLILLDSGGIPPEQAWQLLVSYYEGTRYKYDSLDEYVDRFKNSPLYQPWTEEIEVLVRANLFRQPDGTYTRQMARYVLETDLHAQTPEERQRLDALYAQVTCPVLIIRAGLGLFGPESIVLTDETLQHLLATLPDARAITINEASHTSLLTIPNAVRDAAILEFLGLVG